MRKTNQNLQDEPKSIQKGLLDSRNKTNDDPKVSPEPLWWECLDVHAHYEACSYLSNTEWAEIY